MDQNIVEFYQKIRSDDDLIATFAGANSAEDVATIAVREANKMGLHFTVAEAKAAIMDMEALRANAVNDDELNDFELEMVAAGHMWSCTSNDL